MSMLIGITDDHVPFLQSISLLISSFPGMQVTLQAHNGQDLLDQLARAAVKPTIIAIDINMPVMDGPAAMARLSCEYPEIKVLALTMQEDDLALIRMMRAGCRGWWLKYLAPDELEQAIIELDQHGYYNADPLNVYYRRLPEYDPNEPLSLTTAEKDLLVLCCSDSTADEIDARLDCSDDLKRALYNSLYNKLHVRTRLGAAMEGFRRGKAIQG